LYIHVDNKKQTVMKNFKFWVNDGTRSFQVVVQGMVRYEAEASAKMMYGSAKSVTFIGEVR
jgi:hypothetical protein